ncbi:MAG: TPM domain-containing protein [Microcoleaceae cyanobacterium]
MMQRFKPVRTILLNIILPIFSVILATQLWVTPAQATGIYQIPDLSPGDRTWIIDDGDVLSRVTQGRINKAISKLADDTGNGIRFVTIRRLDYGETVDSFVDQLFEKWFPTDVAGANETVLVLDILTNNSAIHTGSTANTLLSDAIAESVAEETLQVPLRDGNRYNEAFVDATDRLVAVLSGQPDPGAPEVKENIQVEGTFKSAEETDDQTSTIVVVIILVVATVAPMATYFYFQRS